LWDTPTFRGLTADRGRLAQASLNVSKEGGGGTHSPSPPASNYRQQHVFLSIPLRWYPGSISNAFWRSRMAKNCSPTTQAAQAPSPSSSSQHSSWKLYMSLPLRDGTTSKSTHKLKTILRIAQKPLLPASSV